jgi:PAS domain S-box-containing protein
MASRFDRGLTGASSRLKIRRAPRIEPKARIIDLIKARDDADAARALAEAQFRASFEAAAIGKVQTNPHDARIIRVNKAFADMLGYCPKEMVGRVGWDFTAPEDRAGDMEAYQAVLEGRSSAYSREKRYVTRAGERIWARVSATVVRAPDTGRPVLTVGVVENINEQYLARLALEAANKRLARLVEDHAAALAERDLLLKEVYHRVNNNLQVVDGLLLLQSRKLAAPDAVSAIEAMRNRIFALGLVHQQLMSSADLKTFDVGDFLSQLMTHLAAAAPETVKLSIVAAAMTVDLDFAIPLGLLVTELVSNSLQHAFSSDISRIDVSLSVPTDGEVLLRVTDNGLGFPQTSPDQKPSLGLSIVDGLVRQLGGCIWVSGGEGVSWEARLPAPETAGRLSA